MPETHTAWSRISSLVVIILVIKIIKSRKYIELVDKSEEAKTAQEQTLLQRQIDATDKQIDKMVYKLYELTPEEIKIVEGQ